MYILSGDNENPTEKLAQTLGMSGYFAQVLPQEKAKIIQMLQDSGKTVCYIGDGINDSIALKKAHVSISLRGASSVATDTAQIVLMNEDLEQLVKLFEFAKEFNHTMGNSLNQILVPSVVGATGALLFDFTIIDTLLLKQIGLTISLVNSVRPLAKQR
jgi:Cu2+-exporting ATPase